MKSIMLISVRILKYSDPDTFASLVLLNRTWRRVSQQAQLYALQLSSCRSYVASHPSISWPVIEDDLPKYRLAFAQEVKRNLFEAYLRPQETLIKLVSANISSSSAFPGGEAFHFAFSPSGEYILAYSSSRIHVLHIESSELTVQRELKILRRPASISILDDGSKLAVLSSDHKVDVYDLSQDKPEHTQALALDHHPRTIKLSPCGSVLAAAYDGGIEVYALDTAAAPTDKRGVKSDAVDSLLFSRDGTQLLGTTTVSKRPCTVVLTAPYFNPGENDPENAISQLWTTSILFPHSSRDCSHAVLLPNQTDYEVNWAFTFDRAIETFRAVRVDDLRNGTTYFTSPSSPSTTKLLPSTVPASTVSGDLVAAGFHGSQIWCYGVPESLDVSAEMQHKLAAAELYNPPLPLLTQPASSSRNDGQPTTKPRTPKWHMLSENHRNFFVEGHKVCTMDGITGLKWITTPHQSPCERLIAAAPGGVGTSLSFEMDEGGMGAMDGGRLLLLDFRYGIMNGQKRTITLEVGEKEPDVLKEEHRDLEAEVAIVRRRTVAQTRAHQQVVGRSTTVAGRLPAYITSARAAVPPLPRIPSTRKVALASMEERSETSSIRSADDQEALDAPYAPGAPRTAPMIRRAATAAANTRIPIAQQPRDIPRMRAPGGRGELPDESDADNWVPPPPPYSAEPLPLMSDRFKNAVPFDALSSPTSLRRSSTQNSGRSDNSRLQRSSTTYSQTRRPLPLSIPDEDTARPLTSSSAISAVSDPGTAIGTSNAAGNVQFDDLYDVTPQGSPALRSVSPVLVSPIVASPPPVMSASAIDHHPIRDPIPEIPIQHVQTAAPISPRPRHAALNIAVQNISSFTEQQWDLPANNQSTLNRSATTISGPRLDMAPTLSRSATTLTQSRLDAAMPARPNDDHRITDLPPISLMLPVASYNDGPPPTEQPFMSSDSSPPRPPSRAGYESIPTDVSLPSASQLTRLNSRSGRPNSRLIDPSRRMSGQFSSSLQDTHTFPPFQQINAGPPVLQQAQVQPPRAAVGAYSIPPPAPTYPPYQDLQHSFGRGRGSTVLTLPPGMRPDLSRLETIHSVGSVIDQQTYISLAIQQPNQPGSVRPVPVGVSRNGSRAERSAAMNIKEAKKNGWRGRQGTKKRKKGKGDMDETSTAGWTDVSIEAPEMGRKRKEGKCVLM